MKMQWVPMASILLALCIAIAWAADEPSNEKELKGAKKKPAEKPALSTEGMSAEQKAWEKTLEENLGSFYWPRYVEAKKKGRETAWDYVKDDPALPRVLLIGDSISRGYTVPVRHELAGKVNVHRAPANCGSTALGLKKLDLWLGDGKWDVIHFNFGIHDRNTPPKDYAERLEKIVERLKATGATLIWASSTPIPPNSDKYEEGSSVRTNRIAEEIMKKHGIAIDDLYSFIKPDLARYQNPKDCHFKGEGYRRLGKQVAAKILDALKARGK
ncbi:MAG: SGNH/GDSL hydrolase family protein [Planctomycetes bacterium]|nr:SGNH/GDSL hydrolase family protein [Planctomycetota bacterium]